MVAVNNQTNGFSILPNSETSCSVKLATW
jgi:hypothetical protein